MVDIEIDHEDLPWAIDEVMGEIKADVEHLVEYLQQQTDVDITAMAELKWAEMQADLKLRIAEKINEGVKSTVYYEPSF